MPIKKDIAAEHERRAWELRINFMWTQVQIAEELKISQAAVSKILSRLEKRYKKENLEDITRVKNEQVAQLEKAAQVAWANYIENRDARHLTGYLKAKEDIRKILGADAPTRSLNVDVDIDVKQLSDKELEDIIAGKSISGI